MLPPLEDEASPRRKRISFGAPPPGATERSQFEPRRQASCDELFDDYELELEGTSSGEFETMHWCGM